MEEILEKFNEILVNFEEMKIIKEIFKKSQKKI